MMGTILCLCGVLCPTIHTVDLDGKTKSMGGGLYKFSC